MITIDNKVLREFLKESNAIEREYRKIAEEDAYIAWKFLEAFNEITFNRIKEAHRLLMFRLNKRIAGNIREVNVRVGSNIMLKYQDIEKHLNVLITRVPKTESEIQAWHVLFENIHPFEDGNGRIGRIIMNIQRVKNNLPILIIHEGNEQYEYYKWFKLIK